ncbi:hypothetical protein GOP47_0000822 [Adiantum capillus-veneris]|uniref:Uncharacterized protein n=1 Tax=Adiantum capillus-veneris TaxID=13818 RepID=A0A9D4ZR28_ADICA|nr:hypothetical protein GOP47_0000822 [Adiantum capillus-veneris]
MKKPPFSAVHCSRRLRHESAPSPQASTEATFAQAEAATEATLPPFGLWLLTRPLLYTYCRAQLEPVNRILRKQDLPYVQLGQLVEEGCRVLIGWQEAGDVAGEDIMWAGLCLRHRYVQLKRKGRAAFAQTLGDDAMCLQGFLSALASKGGGLSSWTSTRPHAWAQVQAA